MFGRHTLPENIRAHAYHRAGIERCVDGAAGIVAHQQAALQPYLPVIVLRVVPYAYFAGIVLQVAVGSAGAQVAPFSYHGIAQVAIVGFIAVTKNDGVFYLTTHHAVWT